MNYVDIQWKNIAEKWNHKATDGVEVCLEHLRSNRAAIVAEWMAHGQQCKKLESWEPLHGEAHSCVYTTSHPLPLFHILCLSLEQCQLLAWNHCAAGKFTSWLLRGHTFNDELCPRGCKPGDTLTACIISRERLLVCWILSYVIFIQFFHEEYESPQLENIR